MPGFVVAGGFGGFLRYAHAPRLRLGLFEVNPWRRYHSRVVVDWRGAVMWLFTRLGFFSVVRKPGDADSGMVTIRARVRGDLEALKAHYLPNMGEITEGGGTDYPFRAKAPHADFAEAAKRLVNDLNYSNFKNQVLAEQGPKRERV